MLKNTRICKRMQKNAKIAKMKMPKIGKNCQYQQFKKKIPRSTMPSKRWYCDIGPAYFIFRFCVLPCRRMCHHVCRRAHRHACEPTLSSANTSWTVVSRGALPELCGCMVPDASIAEGSTDPTAGGPSMRRIVRRNNART